MIRRRPLLAGLALLPAAARADDASLAATCITAIRAAMATMPSGPILLNSYLVQTGPHQTDFDLTQSNAAYVYDNALAGLALLAAGHPAEAQRISTALAFAQSNDRHWRDGRLRNAYQAGPMSASTPARLPGWWDKGAEIWREDPYQAGSETGPLAWAMLLWAATGQHGPAQAAAHWLETTLRAPAGYYGGFYGFEPTPLKLTWQSTEQNTDIAAAYRKISRPAGHAAAFVTAMFAPARGVFTAGLAPDGAPNPLLAADAGIWPYLAGLGTAASARAAVAGLRHGPGIGFSAASAGIWPEGTAFAALASPTDRAGFLATIAGQISPAGYVYASVAPTLSTGLTVGPSLVPGQPELPFNYFRRPSLSATAWAALAALNANPLAS